jgi:hypothetical protein
MRGYGSSGIRTSRYKRRVGCWHGNPVTGMACWRGHSSRRSLRIVLPPNDPWVWTFRQVVLEALAQRFVREGVQRKKRLADQSGYQLIPQAARICVSPYLSISTSFREPQPSFTASTAPRSKSSNTKTRTTTRSSKASWKTGRAICPTHEANALPRLSRFLSTGCTSPANGIE